MKCVHFGAGNIGRGLIGACMSQNGYEIVFLDTNQEVIQNINQTHSYKIEIVGDSKHIETISNVRAINSKENETEAIQALIEADIITTSVGSLNLAHIAPLLMKGLLKRHQHHKAPVDIIANENSINASSYLQTLLMNQATDFEKKVLSKISGFKNSAIDRQAFTTNYEGQKIPSVETYYEWVIEEKNSINHNKVRFSKAEYVDNMQYSIERKLFCVNAGHAAAAYLGNYLGKRTVQDALADSEIYKLVRSVILENAQYLEDEYQRKHQEMFNFTETILKRHSNRHLADSIDRVGRSPLRKLSNNERLVGVLEYLYKTNEETSALTTVIAVALNFNPQERDEEVEQMRSLIQKCGIQQAIKEITSIQSQDLIDMIALKYERFKTTIHRKKVLEMR